MTIFTVPEQILQKLFLLRQKMAGVKTSEEGTRKLEKLKIEQYINLVQVIDRVATWPLICCPPGWLRPHQRHTLAPSGALVGWPTESGEGWVQWAHFFSNLIVQFCKNSQITNKYHILNSFETLMQNFVIKLIYKYTLQIILERYIFGKPREIIIKLDFKAGNGLYFDESSSELFKN